MVNMNRVYLGEERSISKMHRLYFEAIEKKGWSKVTETYYRVFTENFNMRFMLPRTETSKTCDQYNIQYKSLSAENSAQCKKEWDRHKQSAREASHFLRHKTEKAKAVSWCSWIVFRMDHAHLSVTLFSCNLVDGQPYIPIFINYHNEWSSFLDSHIFPNGIWIQSTVLPQYTFQTDRQMVWQCSVRTPRTLAILIDSDALIIVIQLNKVVPQTHAHPHACIHTNIYTVMNLICLDSG